MATFFVVIFNVHIGLVFVEDVEKGREVVVIHTFDQFGVDVAGSAFPTHGDGSCG